MGEKKGTVSTTAEPTSGEEGSSLAAKAPAKLAVVPVVEKEGKSPAFSPRNQLGHMESKRCPVFSNQSPFASDGVMVARPTSILHGPSMPG